MMHPVYRAEFTIFCRGGDVNGYECYANIVAIDDEEAIDMYRELQKRRWQEQIDAGALVMINYTFCGLFRIHTKETKALLMH